VYLDDALGPERAAIGVHIEAWASLVDTASAARLAVVPLITADELARICRTGYQRPSSTRPPVRSGAAAERIVRNGPCGRGPLALGVQSPPGSRCGAGGLGRSEDR
jgi:hypothetical protein